MALISWSSTEEPWGVAGWAFRAVLDEAKKHVNNPSDVGTLEQAAALKGLNLDLLEPSQAARIIEALDIAAAHIRIRLQGDQADPRDREFRDHLGDLQDRLQLLRSEDQP